MSQYPYMAAANKPKRGQSVLTAGFKTPKPVSTVNISL